MDARAKRARQEGGVNANGGFKKSKQDTESLSSAVGSKSKPCTKFFSIGGCPFGEGCHFLHYVPGGYNAVSQMISLPPLVPPPSRNAVLPPPARSVGLPPPARSVGLPPSQPQNNGSSQPSIKTRLCNKFNTAEGCKYGDKCHFAHGEWDLLKPVAPSLDDSRGMSLPSVPPRMVGPPPAMAPGLATSFGASATAKISVDASLAGAIIGKGGVNSKQICRQTGVKFSIRDHESDPNQKNIELEGTFEQIKQASAMVGELISNIGAAANLSKGGHGHGHGGPGTTPGNNFKTKLCDNFTKGSCTFGDRCHFAHGAAELRKTVV